LTGNIFFVIYEKDSLIHVKRITSDSTILDSQPLQVFSNTLLFDITFLDTHYLCLTGSALEITINELSTTGSLIKSKVVTVANLDTLSPTCAYGLKGISLIDYSRIIDTVNYTNHPEIMIYNTDPN